MGLTFEQITFTEENYLASKLVILCQEVFQEALSNKTVPNKTTVPQLTEKFCDTGSVC
jgi:hypothetical protein